MLVALVTVFFVLGFGTAIVGSTDPENTKTSLDRLLCNIHLFLEFLSSRPIPWQVTTAGVDESIEAGNEFLLTRAQLEEKYEVGTWQRVVFEEFQSTLLGRERDAKKFPCVYATKGFRANDHRYIFLDTDNPSEPRNVKILGPAMRAYLEEAHKLGPNTSLVIICGPSDDIRTVEDYNNRFWDFLRGLRILDTEQWPENVPVKTTDEHWTFCFNGEPIFPIALTPAHEKRRSRYASNMMIAMQPKWVIDNLMNTIEKREHATKIVRSLLVEYDDVDISADLSNYGAPGTTESKQLTLSDENESSECPYDDFDVC